MNILFSCVPLGLTLSYENMKFIQGSRLHDYENVKVLNTRSAEN